ncbi:MAG: hypothetical protein AAF219_08335 [Myxococcota bacterium]
MLCIDVCVDLIDELPSRFGLDYGYRELEASDCKLSDVGRLKSVGQLPDVGQAPVAGTSGLNLAA